MTIAFVFPGQGSQVVGMLDAFAGNPVVADILAQADAALGEPLSEMIAKGPAESLALTVNTQPAMLVAGYACCAAWRAAGGPEAVAVAGHSLGEYTALVAAGSLPLAQAVRLVRLRAQAMQEAVPVGTGGMAVIMGLDDEAVRAACAAAASATEVVEAVNFNAPAQVVIAGHKAAVERACEKAKQAGAKRALPLAVSAPFHSTLLAPAGARLKIALADVALAQPRISLVNNVDVAVEQEPSRIIDALVRQASSPVRWVEVVQRLKAMGVDQVIEFGPGKVLTGLIPRIDKSIKALAVQDPASLDAALQAVRGTAA
ncbi:MAG: ACP S-malonyltransferase [Burkholderiaceae bacterium]|nr:ACP S-malonyltransferase [Burkholderiaceae bacterium]